jgi:hypothetical protein
MPLGRRIKSLVQKSAEYMLVVVAGQAIFEPKTGQKGLTPA